MKILLYKLKIFINYFFDSWKNLFKILNTTKRQIVFDLEDDYHEANDSARHFYMTLYFFGEMGFTIYLRKRITLKGYARLGKYGRLIYSIPSLKITDQIPKKTKNTIYAFDTGANHSLLDKPWKKKIYVNILKPNYFSYGQVLWLPYFMHPLLYSTHTYKNLPRLRVLPKKLRIFFAGNTQEGYYDNINLKRYNQLTRREALKAIIGKIEGVKVIETLPELIKLMKREKKIKECLILETSEKNRLSRLEYIKDIARSDFFLCLSGTDLPMCHNAIEAMALGTIPILAYQDWFFPPLEHMKNAIVYSGKEDLVIKIKEVLAIPENVIQELRYNVLEYYERYLVPQRVLKDIEDDTEDICTIMAVPQLILTSKEEEKENPIKLNLNRVLGEFTKSNFYASNK